MTQNSNKRELALLEAEKKYGKDAADALRAHIDFIGENFYLWLSDLYIPRDCKCDNFDADGNRVCLLPRDSKGICICRGGGFYYSNSARDTDGYEIDIESTVQALHTLNTLGMLENYDDNLALALPKQMRNDVVAFTKSLQSAEDGYFYHSQWGKNILPSRLGRDLNWATAILRDLKDSPLYDTKNGYKGTLGAPKKATYEDNESDSNSGWIPQLKNLAAFEEFLNSMDLKNKSWSEFNTINAMAEQISARDAKALEDGELAEADGCGMAKDGYVRMLEKNFNARQNAENGLWEDGVYYSSVNGLMKISSSYNMMKIKFNHAKEAFQSAIKIALLPPGTPDERGAFAEAAVDVFNPWVSMRHILKNIENFGTKEEYAEITAVFSDNVVALIKNTTEKAKKFKKPDGSFGYSRTTVPYKSQGAPVAVQGTVEGDVNGGTIAVAGILGHMCVALGIPKIPIFCGNDFEKYIERIKKRCNYK